MTETTLPPAPTPRYASPRLERPRDSAIKGVCTAVARTTGTDVVLWRVLLVVLVFFGGLGFVLYLAGIALIPAEGEPHSLAERLVRGPDRSLTGMQVLLLIVLLLAFGGLVADSNGLIAVVVLTGLGILWWRTRTDEGARPSMGTPSVGPAPFPGAWSGPAEDPSQAPHLGGASPVAARPRRRSPLGGITVSLTVLVTGVLLLVGASGEASVPFEVVLAGALLTVGLGLLAGSFFGRSPGLIALAVLLALALGITVGVRPALDAGLGERTWIPSASESYRLGIGDATLDLRELPSAGDAATITARVDVGHLLVLLPEDRRVSLEARAGLGNVQLLGKDHDGRGVDERLEIGPADSPPLILDLSVRTGMVEVRRG